MNEAIVVQGRHLMPQDIHRIRGMIAEHPQWSRWRLSKALCAEWNWCNANGRLKDMAARSLLVKLNERGLIQLPPRRRETPNRMALQSPHRVTWDETPVIAALSEVEPLTIREVTKDAAARIQFAAALDDFHYLGYRGTVGENLQYTVTDKTGRLLACLLFGSAAWQCLSRDRFIGWNPEQRTRNLQLLTNNTRFLILPFIRIPHLASCILGRVLRRLSADWQKKYGHAIVLVETFVENRRFTGTSFRAANWIRVGHTAGRSRQDRRRSLKVPVKDVYVYSLHRRFRRELSR